MVKIIAGHELYINYIIVKFESPITIIIDMIISRKKKNRKKLATQNIQNKIHLDLNLNSTSFRNVSIKRRTIVLYIQFPYVVPFFNFFYNLYS